MNTDAISHTNNGSPQDRIHLHYPDWLRLLAIFMLFLFHIVHPFDFADWQSSWWDHLQLPLACAKRSSGGFAPCEPCSA
jgi:peptidoglycan/LPS O-acetylase OafA/YrhL